MIAPELNLNRNGIGKTEGPMATSTKTKIERYNWVVQDKEGVFMKVLKEQLNIDHGYQRDRISQFKVNSIAGAWSWAACGALLVAMRPDGTLWVFDGQHRKLAADKRADIKELPCMVYETVNQSLEASAFLTVNTKRASMLIVDKYKALLSAGDRTAVAVCVIVKSVGYAIDHGSGKGTLSCAGSLLQGYEISPEIFENALKVCAAVCLGDNFSYKLFDAVFYLERWMESNDDGSLLDNHNMKALKTCGQDGLMTAINRAHGYYGKGGARIYAQGIADAINKGRSTRRIKYGSDSPITSKAAA